MGRNGFASMVEPLLCRAVITTSYSGYNPLPESIAWLYTYANGSINTGISSFTILGVIWSSPGLEFGFSSFTTFCISSGVITMSKFSTCWSCLGPGVHTHQRWIPGLRRLCQRSGRVTRCSASYARHVSLFAVTGQPPSNTPLPSIKKYHDKQ